MPHRNLAVILLAALQLSSLSLHSAQSASDSAPASLQTPDSPKTTAPALPAPEGNRYDVLSQMITPLAGVLLGGRRTTDKALTLKATVGQVAGRLSPSVKGAAFTARIEYPGRIRVDAPVLGSTFTVCRDGKNVWAVPGDKVRFLLGQFRKKPAPHPKNGAPLSLPFTSEQAVLLPALFDLEQSNEVADVGGASCRVISGGLMREIAKSSGAEDFSAKLWICGDYTPKRVDIRREDFAMSFLVEQLTYSPTLPASTWFPPSSVKDVYRCSADDLEQLLYILMNSLQMTPQDKPWLNESPASSLPAPQPLPVLAPSRSTPLGSAHEFLPRADRSNRLLA